MINKASAVILYKKLE